jgi:malate/lactate dehydrogenase
MGPPTLLPELYVPAHEEDIKATLKTPLLLSRRVAGNGIYRAFQGADVVFFSTGAGGKGGEERTRSVDYEGALKVFDTIEA